MPGAGRGPWIRGDRNPPRVSPSLVAIDAMLPPPDPARRGLIVALIQGLVGAGIWGKLSWFSLCAAHAQQPAMLNLRAPSEGLTLMNGPAFTVDRGFTGDGSSIYLDSGWNPVDHGGALFLQNSAHLGVWCGTEAPGGGQVEVGNGRNRINCRNPAGNLLGRVNQGPASNALVAEAEGHSLVIRRPGGLVELYRDGAMIGSDGVPSQTLQPRSMFVLAFNDGLGAANFSHRRVQAVHWGAELSPGEAAILAVLLGDYMTAIGA